MIKTLPDSPLTAEELEEMKTARNSIIHHRGKAKFTDRWGNAHIVHDRFLDFNNAHGQGRVAVDQSLLIELAEKVTRFVKLWNQRQK